MTPSITWLKQLRWQRSHSYNIATKQNHFSCLYSNAILRNSFGNNNGMTGIWLLKVWRKMSEPSFCSEYNLIGRLKDAFDTEQCSCIGCLSGLTAPRIKIFSQFPKFISSILAIGHSNLQRHPSGTVFLLS